MARLHADEDFSFAVVKELRQLGHDVLTTQEAGQAYQRTPDEDVLALAIGQRRAILTFDRRHFIRLHGTHQPHAGILACTRDGDVPALAARIHQALLNCPVLDNQLIRINRPP